MRKKGSFLIAMGLLLIAAALSLTLYNVWDADRADRAAQSAVQSLRELIPKSGETVDGQNAPENTNPPQHDEDPVQPSPGQTETTGPNQPETEPDASGDGRDPSDPLATLPEEREMPTVEVDGYRYIGVLDVQSLELSLPVMEEWDYDRLRISPCRFAGNVYQDDLVICAHNYPQHFTKLKYVPLGTEIKFTDAEGTEFLYAVSSVETVGPNDVEGMIHGDWDLTLFTCNTNGQTRCAIRCDRVF